MASEFKKGDKVCVKCAAVIDRKNQRQPWHSEQIKSKDKYILELLEKLSDAEEILKMLGCFKNWKIAPVGGKSRFFYNTSIYIQFTKYIQGSKNGK